MKLSDFLERIKYFKQAEVKRLGSNVLDVHEGIFYCLDSVRDELGVPIGLICLDKLKHVPNSYHYKKPCMAVDFYTMKPVRRYKVVMAMLNAGFTGIGINGENSYHGDLRTLGYAMWENKNDYYVHLI